MVALIAVALAAGDRGRPRWAGVAWSVAVLVKWVPALLLPLRALDARASRRRVDHVAFAATTLIVLGVATVLWRFHWLHAVGPLSRNAARETSYALPQRTGLPWWLFAGAYAVAYVWLLREATRGRARLGLALALLLPALPYLIAWYVLWPLTLSPYDEDDTAIVLSLVLCAYLLPQRIPV
jgi:hypothetical protein